jgi:hypothetical protein
MKAKLFAAIRLPVLLGLFSVFAYYSLFSKFSDFDDEGLLMITLREYVQQGHALYDEVYSYYGPFYYLVHRVLHGTFGVPITHDSIRWIYLGIWLFLAFACFRVVVHLTGSWVAAVLACIPFNWMLAQLAGGPAHPQGIVLVLIAVILILPSLGLFTEDRRTSWLFGGMGAAVAALVLVKPNIGVFMILSLLWAILAMTRGNQLTVWARYALAVGCLLLPPLLMLSHLAELWAQKYALLTMATWLPILILLVRPVRRIEISTKDWCWLLVSGAAAAAAILAATMLGGSTVHGMISVLIQQPMRFASKYFVPPYISRGALLGAMLSLVLFGIHLLIERSTNRTWSVRLDLLLMSYFGFGAMYYFYQTRYWDVWYHASFLLWVPLRHFQTLRSETPNRYFLRILLVLTAAFQILHAYPVAGSQAAWAMIWIIPVAAVCLYDLWCAVPAGAFVLRPEWAALRKTAAAILLLGAIGLTVQRTTFAIERYRSFEPLHLPGADRLRVDHNSAEVYRSLTRNLRTHTDTFLGLPGLPSLYFWTGKEPPSNLILGFWMALLDDAQQQSIVDTLSHYPEAGVIRNKGLIDFWAPGRSFDDRPLVMYINQNFRTTAWLGGYEFMVRKEREGIHLQ